MTAVAELLADFNSHDKCDRLNSGIKATHLLSDSGQFLHVGCMKHQLSFIAVLRLNTVMKMNPVSKAKVATTRTTKCYKQKCSD